VIKNFLHKNYLIYGGSIVATRVLEYAVLFFAAHYLSKDNYGELEYYKKLIEVVSSVFAFGFPALIISYTKSKESKQYFFLLGCIFVLLLAIVSMLVLGIFNWLFLLVPFVFYALFFNGGITPAYLLVKEGSNYASVYKILISGLFYAVIFVAIYFFDVTGMAYVVAGYILFPIAFVYVGYQLLQQKLVKQKILKYGRLFKKLLLSSFTLVVSNFANLMFLYTDIFIIKIISENANTEIANYSFALNVANMLLLIPLTLVQVDIEKLKNNFSHVSVLNKRIVLLSGLAAIFLVFVYVMLINTLYIDYKGFFTAFLIILAAKFVQSLSPLYGSLMVINKLFRKNLEVNLFALVLNIVLSYFLYQYYSINGIAIASFISLVVRYIIQRIVLNKFYK
tara:strand:+ start:245557 stop:246738 length:1182 start_codon:yes stop_codon:yes gene_type:complete